MKRRNFVNVVVSCLSLSGALSVTGCGESRVQPQISTSTPAPLAVTVSPDSLFIKRGGTWTFSASVTNTSDQTVSWTIQESPAGGAVSNAGVYTAPASLGVYHIVATSKADPSKSATAIVNVGSSGFTPTGKLANARSSHTATLLPNGKVYIAGGYIDSTTIDDGIAVVDQAELFDPATEAFQAAGKLALADHTATFLPNGDVLYVGGISDETDAGYVLSAGADLLRSGTGTLQPTGGLSVARYDHTATLLQNGKVLIAGGAVQSSTAYAYPPTQTAELYDPATGTFTRVGDMGVARYGHFATLLSNGKVLIIGGNVQSGSNVVPTEKAELYDPATNSFTSAGSTASKWVGGATLLADGRVLISGEANSDFSALAPSEVYDPATGKFSPTGTMTTLRYGYTATLLPDGTVLIAGGYIEVAGPTPGSYIQTPLATTEVYTPATGVFSPGPTMRQARAGHTATLMADGSVLLVGGRGNCCGLGTQTSSAEVYQ